MRPAHGTRVPNLTLTGWLLLTLLCPALTWAAGACTSGVSAGWQAINVHSSGQDRRMWLYAPAAAVGRTGVPMVFDLHGSGGNGRGQAQHSGLSTQADLHGFLLANPDGGIPDPANPREKFYWNLPGIPLTGNVPIPPDAPDDVQFFRDAIQQLRQSACIDPHRVYVTGFSGGARMTSLLACELADQLAAVAPVAGLRAGAPQAGDLSKTDAGACTPRRPVPIIAFHGLHDPTNRYDGDGEKRWGYSVPTAFMRWAQIDGCQAVPSEQPVSAHVTRVTVARCRNSSELILYRTDASLEHGGGHIWPHPGGANSSGSAVERVDQLDASALIWEFFSRHRMP